MKWPDFSDLRDEIRDFYLPSNYARAWTTDNKLTPQAQTIIRVLQDVDVKGLHPEDYDGPLWNDRVARIASPGSKPSPAELDRFDLSLTVSVLRYLSALHRGRVDPRRLRVDLNIDHNRYKLGEFVRSNLVKAPDVNAVFDQVECAYAGYRRTLMALKHYMDLAKQGEGDPLPAITKAIKPGGTYPGLNALATRLQRLADLSPADWHASGSNAYEGAVVESVKHFQVRHGLTPNGIIDQVTYQNLVTPFSRRIVQFQLALERWRWLPRNLPGRMIAVNVPEFELRAYDDYHVTIDMRVIVGKSFPERRTPLFQDQMEYLIFRPYWNVPIRITRNEIIPDLRKKPGYMAKHEFEVVTRQDQVVAADVSDSSVIARLRSGDLEIRQRPGPGNSLGLIKFVFPNDYDVYMHGTPEHALFSRAERAMSHGCVRVEDPAKLAAWVLQSNPEWTNEKIEAAMNASQSERVNLPKPIPVLILYATAAVDESGEVGFFADIYGQDAKLEQELAKGYPYPL
ncbi:MAG TPA: L,D-transpeptidase family protein [Candidatus Binatia bacterium]|nr:L,D-transpeptidase family protein [Candidatus Binatia bacterium]